MKYQLVLQLPAASISDYDEMISFEEALVDNLDNLGIVDGHDAGSGEMNIFIHTNDPGAAFEKIRGFSFVQRFLPHLKVAYRGLSSETYEILYPAKLTSFKIS